MRNERTAANKLFPLPKIAVEPTPLILDHPYIAKWKLRFQTNLVDFEREPWEFLRNQTQITTS